MTTAQRFRRALFWALTGGALARLYVLGEAQGWALVGPVALRITGLTLAAWFGHLLLHEAGHLVVSRLTGFQLDSASVGPLEWNARTRSWSWAGPSLGGRIGILPVGPRRLRQRLRLVALAGPVMSLLATTALAVLWAARHEPVFSLLGIGFVTGVLVLVSAATPGRFREATAIAGNDVDQIIGGRRVVAHWTYLALVQGVLAGKRPRDVLELVDLDGLVPPPGAPPEPITLISAVSHLERGAVAEATRVLDAAVAGPPANLSWVQTDVFHQRGAIAALVEHDLSRAVACLDVVKQHQSLEWYADLLEACIAKASGDDVMATKRLDRWLSEAQVATGGRLAFGGNEWVLDRLRPGWRG